MFRDQPFRLIREIFHAASCNMKKLHYDLTAAHTGRVTFTGPGKKKVDSLALARHLFDLS